MEHDDIEARLRDFIDKALMRGQGADLDASTPLFELGILDSFTLFTVINFIATEFNVVLRLEQLRSEEFATIATIAAVVRSRLAAACAPGA